MPFKSRCCAAIIGLSAFGFADAASEPPHKTPAEIIPITQSNLRGHQSLYREGWFIISSSEKALRYAKEHSITSSGQAVSRLLKETGQHSSDYGKGLLEAGKQGVQTGQEFHAGGTALSRQELGWTSDLMRAEWDYGSENMGQAWRSLIKGNLTLAQRTTEDREALIAIPGDWYKTLAHDFHNVDELTVQATQAMSTGIEARWQDAFREARTDFEQSYRQSGTRGNALSGLGDIMAGYVKVLYSGLLKPAARTTAQGTEAAAKGALTLVFLPASKLFIVSGRTVASTGLSLYYTTSMGIKLVSPTVEGGLLAGLSLLSYSAIPVTAAVGGSIGAINQVAVTTATPVVGAGRTVATGAAETGIYAVQVSYDLLKETTTVAMNQVQSGVVLGYNALTALPTQMLLGAANGAVFLAYDGPRLVLATAQGEVSWRNERGEQGRAPVQSLPVGSVVNLDSLGQQSGVQVKILSDDPELMQKVLEKLPNDLRSGEQP